MTVTNGAMEDYSVAKEPTDELTLEIMRHLEIDQQWVRHFDPTNVNGIAEARAAGRRAGRGLQLKVLTHQSKPEDRDDNRVVVIVVVNQERSPEDEERLQERARLLLDEAYKHFRTP
ncbi:hypothetical protein AB0K15_13135 [Amycolatopsis sp. NPDC049253]|uniref:hypothetical protein n=1 Tax=Amycolatopsis sp. NPDC049253 TaxID=3155274 RepID=UPI0034358B33